jgi:hypothetical protein
VHRFVAYESAAEPSWRISIIRYFGAPERARQKTVAPQAVTRSNAADAAVGTPFVLSPSNDESKAGLVPAMPLECVRIVGLLAAVFFGNSKGSMQ